MPRKAVFTKEHVIEGALALIRQRGSNNFSMRHVAQEMGSSTQPIYSFFQNAEELIEAILDHTELALLQELREERSPYPFRNWVFGFLMFAKRESALLEFYFNQPKRVNVFKSTFLEGLIFGFNADKRFGRLSVEKKKEMAERNWNYALGLSLPRIRGLFGWPTEESLMDEIRKMGDAFYKEAMADSGLAKIRVAV